jgi:hypothetical protein
VYIIHNLKELDLVPEAAGFRVVVSGHSHQPSIQERDGVLFVNPGSAGARRFTLPVSLALMEVRDRSVEVTLVTLQDPHAPKGKRHPVFRVLGPAARAEPLGRIGRPERLWGFRRGDLPGG